ncbi:putative nicotinate-nucleotide adenylyltransferase [Caloramator mitchellensis]|uniref:bis(5'-nucleosyl)-tetraphosphatase (symmetrical) n=1 Tax=Caloramator mitchellensis TaxID=908809 RepID=A0A0R3K6U5_CALMK|nr:bis(5'-nucleosyl)-tetraphosphatase (symmetrical) YqeK [Caloramator mitchellensis]KRQ88159.1 putative nicotinate-nucleotide adenylyltransferase [Caloramator mitchellensis]
MNIKEIEQKLKFILDEKRMIHSLNVANSALELAKYYGIDLQKIEVAALLHDCAKNFSKDELITLAGNYKIEIDEVQRNSPFLLHGPVGAYFAKYEFGIYDDDIFNSIYFHTTGRKNMSLFEKIIYIADMISIDRSYPEVDLIRELVKVDLDKALIEATNSTLKYVIQRNLLIHPLTIDFRNWLLMKGGK